MTESLSPHAQPSSATPPTTSQPSPDRLTSLTRLVIGGVEYGLEELFQQLAGWEQQVSDAKAAAQAPDATQEQQEPSLRHALIGFIFASETALRKNIEVASQLTTLAGRSIEPVMQQVNRVPFVQPFERVLQALVQRGECELADWKKIGLKEETHARALAEAAFSKTVDGYIQYLTDNPEVQQLVQTQSTGLAAEAIEEVRERSVSADTFLEGIAHRLLRKSPPSGPPALSPAEFPSRPSTTTGNTE